MTFGKVDAHLFGPDYAGRQHDRSENFEEGNNVERSTSQRSSFSSV